MEEIVEGIRQVVIFVLVFQVVLNLFAQSKYLRYFRFFEGLMVMILFMTPLFTRMGAGEEWERRLIKNWTTFEAEWESPEFEEIEKERAELLTEAGTEERMVSDDENR